jgi:DNA-binding transcriptional regulator YiaG
MTRLIDFLPIDHPLRKDVTPFVPWSKTRNKRPDKSWTPLFLTTTIFLNPFRTRVSQEFAGDQPAEVLSFLEKRGFSHTERAELSLGRPLDSGDSKKQYHLDPPLPKERLGDIRKPKPKEAAMPNIKPTLEGWGKKVKKLRNEAHLSQDEMSHRLGYSYNIVSGVELETRKFSPAEKTLFFQTIKQPEDTSIPVLNEKELAYRNKVHGVQAKKKESRTKAPMETRAAEPSAFIPTKDRIKDIPLLTHLTPIKAGIIRDFTATISHKGVTDEQATQIQVALDRLILSVLLPGSR